MNMALTFGVIYIRQIYHFSWVIYIYIYILEDGFKDLNKVNPKAAESLEIVAIWKKKKRKEDGFNVISLRYIYIYI